MIYGSVCSGIEAASAAWHPLGWRAAFLSEIEAFPRAVLTHHYASTPLHGDFTTIQADQYDPIDLLVGGTPCQSFSVAGLRGGLADERGNLALEYLRLADRLRPRWLLWENVPGVLSSNGGRDFGSFLGGMGQLGYGFAYRVLDAQFFGLAQRRKRVFVVGYLGDWRRAAAVLFEPQSLRRDTPPRRQAGQDTAGTLAFGAHPGGCNGRDVESGLLIAGTLTGNGDAHSGFKDCNGLIAHSLRADGFDASEDGTGRGTPLVPVYAIQERAVCENTNAGPGGCGWNGDGASYTLEGRHHVQAVAFDLAQITSATNRSRVAEGLPASTLNAAGGIHVAQGITIHGTDGTTSVASMTDLASALRARVSGMHENSTTTAVMQRAMVRRLMPAECEKLQGFEPGHTDIPFRGKPAADGPRYRALGNSFAVPVVRWIGERIAAQEAQIKQEAIRAA